MFASNPLFRQQRSWRYNVEPPPREAAGHPPDHLLSLAVKDKVCAKIFPGRLHHFALDTDWLRKTVIARRQSPKIEFKENIGSGSL